MRGAGSATRGIVSFRQSLEVRGSNHHAQADVLKWRLTWQSLRRQQARRARRRPQPDQARRRHRPLQPRRARTRASPGNPAGGPVGSRHRQQLNGEFIAALLRDFRHGGPKAIERVRRTQPAAYLKILALLCPREHKVEQSNVIKSLSDQELEAMIEYIKTSLEAQAGGSVRVIEGTIEPAAATAHALKPKNRLMLEADTAVGPRERTPRQRKVPSPPAA